ncbi:Hypothetical protein FKW44_024046 [Caligus rogercresseyi]|uniref:Uncharacterized protein n=1 Tax=Caligus rogercresseyi TaxID=217165 RepID=A0A7T8JVT9_CALRO|nr:Hypothetical protein FKW44_024046 [Caligus rogercresseyi]
MSKGIGGVLRDDDPIVWSARSLEDLFPLLHKFLGESGIVQARKIIINDATSQSSKSFLPHFLIASL